MMSAEQLLSNLREFYGTENYHHHWCGGQILLTDGAAFLREAANCFWLFDIIASIKPLLRKKDHFHVIKLTKQGDGEAVFVADDGNGNVHYTQKIGLTDFPLESLELYFADDVVMLKSEY